MIPQLFQFDFATICTRNSQPFVASVTWNATKKSVDRQYFPITITPTGRFEESAQSTFTASVGQIIETRRGKSRSRDFRSFNLVAPTGYLIMLGMADDITEVMSIMEYLAGHIPADHLSHGRWKFETVTSDWKGSLVPTVTHDGNGTGPTQYQQQLQQTQTRLEEQLSHVRALIQDQPIPTSPKVIKPKRTKTLTT